MSWYYVNNGQSVGPVEEGALVEMARTGQLRPETLVWNESMGPDWQPAEKIPILAASMSPAFVPSAPPPPRPEPPTGPEASNKELMHRARMALDGRWGISIGLIVLWYLLLFAIMIPASLMSCIGVIAEYLVLPPMLVGATGFFLTISRRREPAIGQMFEGFKAFGGAVGAFVLLALMLVGVMLVVMTPFFIVLISTVGATFFHVLNDSSPAVSPAMMAGMPLLAVTVGIASYIAAIVLVVWLQLRFALIYPLLADHPKMGPVVALKRSAQIMCGRKWKLFCLYFRFWGWMLLAIITCGIGYLWLIPYMATSHAAFYDEAAAHTPEA